MEDHNNTKEGSFSSEISSEEWIEIEKNARIVGERDTYFKVLHRIYDLVMDYSEDEVRLSAKEIIVLIKYYLERDIHFCCFNRGGAQREQNGPFKRYTKGVDGRLRFEDEQRDTEAVLGTKKK